MRPPVACSPGGPRPLLLSPQICSRCARIRDEFGNYDESLQYAAESILRMAQEQSPDNASLALAYARFLKVVRLDNAGCLSQMLRVAKMPMSINTRMMYFWMDRDHKSYVRTQGHGSGESISAL